MIDNCVNQENCTGCKMCKDICPKKAISFTIDEEGFWYPKVDYDKCIKCKICVNKCPVLCETQPTKEILGVYSSWLKDDKMRLASTSGGMFYAMADWILSKGGYIVGSQYADDYKSAYHTFANNEDGLKRIIGSKYFQSDTDGIYLKVKELLKENKMVLFCGTPCQSAAMQSYFKKIPEQLYIVDFICRGVNSPLIFKKHIDELENQYQSPVEYVHLKNKKTGWQSLATYIKFKNGKEYHQDLNSSLWIRGFIAGGNLFSRECCYQCKYKKIPRISDITIGDFWGIKEVRKEELFKGISLLMINSEKGQYIFDNIKNKIEYKKEKLNLALDGNPAFTQSAIRHKNRELFFKLIKTHTFSDAVKKCTSFKKKSILKKMGLKVSNILEKVVFFFAISTYKFIKYNFFSKNIIRDKHCFLIPYKNTIINLSKESRIYIKGKSIEIGVNKLKGSKAETYLRMSGNSVWESNNGCQLFYDTTLEITKNGLFETDYFSMNCGGVIICSKHIKFGEDVMMGRNIIIYDNDHHQVFDENYQISNQSKTVIIEEHVWLTSNVTVLKGVTIGENTLITAKTLVRKDIPKNSIVGGGSSGKVIAPCTGWSRKSV